MNAPLRGCPTCGTRVDQTAGGLGLRDYRWVAPKLPGRVAPTDIDSVLETNGHFLIMEMKPEGVSLPMGQRIMLRRLLKLDPEHITILVVRGEGERVEVSELDTHGDFANTRWLSQDELGDLVASWFAYHNAGRNVT